MYLFDRHVPGHLGDVANGTTDVLIVRTRGMLKRCRRISRTREFIFGSDSSDALIMNGVFWAAVFGLRLSRIFSVAEFIR